jgi:hypothetical protein
MIIIDRPHRDIFICKTAITEAKPSIDAITRPLNIVNMHVFDDLCNIKSNSF